MFNLPHSGLEISIKFHDGTPQQLQIDSLNAATIAVERVLNDWLISNGLKHIYPTVELPRQTE